jgi:hypothetical protein
VLLVQEICDVRADDVFVSVGGGGCGGVNVNAQYAACRDQDQGATQNVLYLIIRGRSL